MESQVQKSRENRMLGRGRNNSTTDMRRSNSM